MSTVLDPATHAALDEAVATGLSYLRERIAPHPILRESLPEGALLVTGGYAVGLWDETGPLSLRLILRDELWRQVRASLQREHLWEAGKDLLLRLEDGEPFHRFPSCRLLILSQSQWRRELERDQVVALWTYTHAAVVQDPLSLMVTDLERTGSLFRSRLAALQRSHYFTFRRSRIDSSTGLSPPRADLLALMQRADAVRSALRLCFLAEGRPYPQDRWLELMAERETVSGSHVIDAIRALFAATGCTGVERTSKVLRDRVVQTLQQAHFPALWLDEWWLWPYMDDVRPAV